PYPTDEFKAGSTTVLKNDPEAQEEIRNAVATAMAEFKPDMAMFELYPFVMDFRDYTLEGLERYEREHGVRVLHTNLCRDIIHSFDPAAIVEKLNDRFDHIMVRGDEGFIRLEDSQPEWANIRTPTTWAGNFVSP